MTVFRENKASDKIFDSPNENILYKITQTSHIKILALNFKG